MKPFVLALALLSAPLLLNAADKTDNATTLEGTLVSASCYMGDHSATGNEMNGAKECGSGCLRMGRPGGLLTKENTFYLLDAPSLPLAPYVGKQIRVTGEERSNDILSVHKAEVNKDGAWQPVDISLHAKK